jgi:hypothetical protein
VTRPIVGPDGLDTGTRVYLAQAPTWALERELAGRRLKPFDPVIRLGSLEVDPVGCRVRWGHDAHRVGGREMEVVYALAAARRSGYVRVPARELTRTIFRGWDSATAATNLRQYVCQVNRRIPGLILGSTAYRLGYALAETDEEREQKTG